MDAMAVVILAAPVAALLLVLLYVLGKVSSKPTPPEPTMLERYYRVDGSYGGSDDDD
jgi:hypothetical protein